MLIVICPNCNVYVEILEINCAIFRHGIYKNNNSQMPPHLPEKDCLDAKEKDLIYGCGLPFKIVNGVAEKCGFI